MAERKVYKKDLNQLRRSLDAIDAQLIMHLVQRFKISEQIAGVKLEKQLQTEDLGRELEILAACEQNAAELGASEKQRGYIRELMSAVIAASKAVQKDARDSASNAD